MFYVLAVNSLNAQQSNITRTQSIEIVKDTIFLSKLIILPNSIQIKSADSVLIDTASFTLNYIESYIVFNTKPNDSLLPLQITYKVFPFDLKSEYSHKKLSLILDSSSSNHDFISYYYNESNKKTNGLRDLDDFQKSGSISRAISVGNSQNLSVLSNLNLQIAGRISDDLELIASVSDDNIPIQPDGNTQQLQDFDKVFIQLKHKNGQLTAGDFEMNRPNSYFLNYHKKAQGANASVNIALQNDRRLKVYGGVALSRGKYARNSINGIEGNQGPYKLIGANFERAIVILSGTEQVYIDGKQLKRGQNYDYVIDYNTAEITFMPTFPITKDKRISVEFQYSDRNYARYLSNAGIEYSTKKLSIATHYFSESDLKNQPLDQELTEYQKQLMYDIGDSLHLAISPSIDSIAFNGNEVLYKKIDSMGYTPVYVYSTSPDSAFYRLSFSMVGAGNGNYIQEKSSANGRVFKWVAPVNGIKQGDYEAVVLLVTPKKKQMLTTKADYEIIKNLNLNIELAVSDEDLNTFSPYNKSNNTAGALRIGLKNKINLSKKEKPWQLLSNATYEFIDANFSPIERFRGVEFSRDWNAQNIGNKDQHLIGFNLCLHKANTSKIEYNNKQFVSNSIYRASKNRILANILEKSWLINADISLMNSDELYRKTNFLRHEINIEKKFRKFNIGILENGETNTFTPKNNDSLLLNSQKFEEFTAYIQSGENSKVDMRVHYKHRLDYLPLNMEFEKVIDANEAGMKLALLKNAKNRLNILINYRQMNVLDSSMTSVKPEETSSGRLEHDYRATNGSITTQTFYQIGSGMETKKDFSYIEVATGQGVYSWNDYNENGVKELNEFEVAAFKDQANYIRVYMPGTNYVKTYNNMFSTSVMLNPSRVWRNSEKALLRLLSQFSNQLNYRSNIKTLNKEKTTYTNPFFKNINDTALISLNSSIRNTFYFNRSHSVYGADYTFLNNSNKVLMMNGYEGRSRTEHQLKLRWNLNRKYLLQINGKSGNKTSVSDYFSSREFDINSKEVGFKISFQPNRVFRLTLPVSYGDKHNNNNYGGQKSETYKLGINAKYNMLSKGSFTGNINSIRINYNSESGDAVAFEMLEGLLPGQNYTWNLSYQRSLLQNLQLNIIYNGRKSEESDVIHVGSVQLRAFF